MSKELLLISSTPPPLSPPGIFTKLKPATDVRFHLQTVDGVIKDVSSYNHVINNSGHITVDSEGFINNGNTSGFLEISSANFPSLMQDFTVEMRVKITDLSKSYHQMVGNWTSRNFQFTYRGVGGNYFGFEDTPGWVISPYSPELNTYMHIAFVRHNGVFFCYKNGVKAQLSRLPTNEVRRTENIKIFQVYGSTGFSLIGGLYDVRFSQSAVYTDNFEINPLPLV